GSSRFWRRHHLNYVRWADDFIVTANSREVLEEVVLPRINAFLAELGVPLTTEKTVITPSRGALTFEEQTLRKHERRNGKPAKLRITPSKASFQALKDQLRTRCKQAVGATAEALIDTLNPRLARLGELSSPCDL